jgi:hypothetical protein
MSGYGWFTLPCDAGYAGQPTCWDEGWGLYQTIADSGLAFDGSMDDSEPASVAPLSFDEAYQQRARWHIDFLKGIKSRIGGMSLYHASPAWLDDRPPITMEDGAEAKTLNAWIADVVDVNALMSYRDTATAIMDVAATELATGPTLLGVELNDAGEGGHVDFSEEGAAAMLIEIEAIEEAQSDNPNFMGTMIHDYGALKPG